MPSTIEQNRSDAEKVRVFADAEMDAARLPGAQFGPADAYRHIVAAAELQRRLGPAAAVILAACRVWVCRRLVRSAGPPQAAASRWSLRQL